jgi:hypothetical protein
MVAVLATYSMVALASPERTVGELTVTGNGSNGETPFVTVNGESAKSGRSIFTSSVIATPSNAGAVINLGKTGVIELAPNTTFSISFDNTSISGDLKAGTLTVLGASTGVDVKTSDGRMVRAVAGESVTTAGKAQDDDDDDDAGGAAWWLWAIVFGGAAAGVLIAATQDNTANLGGGATTVSPTR